MNISDISQEQLDKELIDRVLFHGTDDDGCRGEVIFVFGSLKATYYRVPLAVELYFNLRAPKIMVSGGNQDYPEALAMQEKAIELGVPKDDIWVESKSSNTTENVQESMKILDEKLGLNSINRILIVTTSYHMRRSYLTLKTFMPDHICFSMCSAQDNNTRRDNWWLSRAGVDRVMKEVEGLVHYTRTGQIVDAEV